MTELTLPKTRSLIRQRKFFSDTYDQVPLGIIEEGEVVPYDKLVTVGSKIQMTCTRCGGNKNGLVKNILKTKVCVCDACSIAKARGGLTFQSFSVLAAEEGYTITNEPIRLTDKAKVAIRCPKGHDYFTTPARWKKPCRCPKCRNESMKVSINTVKAKFIERGYEPMFDKYSNNATPLQVRCHCGEIAMITYGNVLRGEGIGGCQSCYVAGKPKVTWNKVRALFVKNGCEILSAESEYTSRYSTLWFKCSCGKEGHVSYKLFRAGQRCANCTDDRRKETCMEKYDAPNPFQSETIKKQIRATTKERYGAEHVMQIQEFVNKSKTTNKQHHGGVHNLSLPAMRVLTLAGQKKKYGDKYYFGSEEYRELIQSAYGVDHPMQCPEFFERVTKYKRKPYTWPSGKISLVQGYEPFALDMLLEKGYKEEEIETSASKIPDITYTYNDKISTYHPDIYIPHQDLIIEVKCPYTMENDYERNIKKFQACAVKGHNMVLWIIDAKKILVETRQFCSVELVFGTEEESSRPSQQNGDEEDYDGLYEDAE